VADKEISIVFLIVDIIVISFDLTGLVAVVLGRGRSNVLIQELDVFLGQIEDFAVGGGKSNILGRSGGNYLSNLIRKIFYFIFNQFGSLLLPFFFDDG